MIASYTLDDSIGYLSRRVSRALGRRLLYNFKEADLTVTIDQWLLLVCLYQHDGQNQQCIGDFCGKDRASITRMIDQLEKQKFVSRKTDPADRRNNLIHVSADGKALTEELMAIAHATLDQAVSGIPSQDVATCRMTLDKILVNLQEDCGEYSPGIRIGAPVRKPNLKNAPQTNNNSPQR